MTLFYLKITCPDQAGIIHHTTHFLHRLDANVLSLDEFVTPGEVPQLFMRLVFTLPERVAENLDELKAQFDCDVAVPNRMTWTMRSSTDKPRLAVLVSRHQHVLREILWYMQEGWLPAELVAVISNHDDCRSLVESAGVPYHHIPFTKNNRQEAEKEIQATLEACGGTDAIVLARFMQIISGDFVSLYPQKIINIHHSFLPAFAGGMAYKQAHAKGVKQIGATAHYVTAELDEGPIIEQKTIDVSHEYTAKALEQRGKNVERHVLMQALVSHLDDRVFVHNGKTIVFTPRYYA